MLKDINQIIEEYKYFRASDYGFDAISFIVKLKELKEHTDDLTIAYDIIRKHEPILIEIANNFHKMYQDDLKQVKKDDKKQDDKDIKLATRFFNDRYNDLSNLEIKDRLKYIKKSYKKISMQNKINNPSYYSTLDKLFKDRIEELENKLKK